MGTLENNFGSVIGSLADAPADTGAVVLFNVKDWFIEQEVFVRNGEGHFYRQNPEENCGSYRYTYPYTLEELFYIADAHGKKVAVTNALTLPQGDVTVENVVELPRFTLLVADYRFLMKVHRDEWWDMSGFVEDSGFYIWRDADVVGLDAKVVWDPKVIEN